MSQVREEEDTKTTQYDNIYLRIKHWIFDLGHISALAIDARFDSLAVVGISISSSLINRDVTTSFF